MTLGSQHLLHRRDAAGGRAVHRWHVRVLARQSEAPNLLREAAPRPVDRGKGAAPHVAHRLPPAIAPREPRFRHVRRVAANLGEKALAKLLVRKVRQELRPVACRLRVDQPPGGCGSHLRRLDGRVAVVCEERPLAARQGYEVASIGQHRPVNAEDHTTAGRVCYHPERPVDVARQLRQKTAGLGGGGGADDRVGGDEAITRLHSGNGTLTDDDALHLGGKANPVGNSLNEGFGELTHPAFGCHELDGFEDESPQHGHAVRDAHLFGFGEGKDPYARSRQPFERFGAAMGTDPVGDALLRVERQHPRRIGEAQIGGLAPESQPDADELQQSLGREQPEGEDRPQRPPRITLVEDSKPTARPDPGSTAAWAHRHAEFAAELEGGAVRPRPHLRARVDPASVHFLHGDAPAGVAGRLQHEEVHAPLAQLVGGGESGGTGANDHHPHCASGPSTA